MGVWSAVRIDVRRSAGSVMQRIRRAKAFTLIELLVGLLVTSILLSAVATLAFAMSSAQTASGDTACKQAQVRQATLYLAELIGNCQLLCAAPGTDLVVWREDTNGNQRINVNELVYVERGPGRNLLRLCRFSSAGNPEITLAELALPTTKDQLLGNANAAYVPLLPQCANVQFRWDAAPPRTRLFDVSFDLSENNLTRRYEINTALRAWAGHLLNASGTEIVNGDDD
jgi:prepilin-type N-terminal cleavage/methylation domain-containing protein